MRKRISGLILASMLAGTCGVSVAQTFTLHSPELESGKFSNANLLSEPYGFGCKGKNISPSFTWSGVPAGTKSLVLTIHDRDAPTGVGWMHWVVANIPAGAKGLPAGIDAKGTNCLADRSKRGLTSVSPVTEARARRKGLRIILRSPSLL